MVGRPAEGGGEGGPAVATARVELLEGWGVVRTVAVDERLRGQGLGMLAVAHAVRRARASARQRGQELRGLALLTETAPAFFERMGFRAVERGSLPGALRSSRHLREECPSATAMLRELPTVAAGAGSPQ